MIVNYQTGESKDFSSISEVNSDIVNIDFHRAIFENRCFSNVKFIDCNLRNTNFYNCQFKDVEFLNCEMMNIVFLKCSFENLKISDSMLIAGQFLETHFTGKNIIKGTDVAFMRLKSDYNKYLLLDNCKRDKDIDLI